MQHATAWNTVQRKMRSKREASDRAHGLTDRARPGPACKSYRAEWETLSSPGGDFTEWCIQQGLITRDQLVWRPQKKR